ncbi:MAG: fused MFS/spermidine synthase [Bryobacterales bacterium]|nr:fused MFS/spermidine synthase [Bryobacterales bacterium]
MDNSRNSSRALPPSWLFGSAIFLGAFLLFQIQPLIARFILPWFGGGAGVWSASLMFFQAALLGGYLYAHRLRRREPHVLLLAASLFLLPVIPAAHWKPVGGEEPISRILLVLAATVGLQYLLLASTSPLLQAVWRGWSGGEGRYHWYALSNAGSLLGLLTYPVLVEPYLGRRAQAWLWSIAYLLYAGLVAAVFLTRPDRWDSHGTSNAPARESASRIAIWIIAPAAASVLLLAATEHISEEIIPAPLIWVVPLSLYLSSFIVSFGGWYRRWLFVPLAMLGLLGMAALLEWPSLAFDAKAATAGVSLGVFLVGAYCHGEVFLRRPHPQYLTRFYLCVAAGGALGGILVTIVAPLALPVAGDFAVALTLCAALLVALEFRRRVWWRIIPAAACFAAVAYAAVMYTGALAVDSVALVRNFYGALRVTEEPTPYPKLKALVLTHGIIEHGSQLMDPILRRQPTMYYAIGSGIQIAVENMRHGPQRVGVIGLGTGTMAAFSRPGDVYRFYEIDPQVVRLATNIFYYLRDSEARVEVVLGDARLALEREQPQHYDLLVLDAFSGDVIPAHLLTREAMTLYLRHLNQGGMLAFHTSSKALRLVPVAGALARDFHLAGLVIDTGDDPAVYRRHATWILLSRDARAFLTRGPAGFFGKGIPPWTRPDVPAWTDDYSNFWRLMR